MNSVLTQKYQILFKFCGNLFRTACVRLYAFFYIRRFILFLILFHCHNQNKRHFSFHKISVWLKDFIPSLRCPLDCWPNSFISFTTHRITENAKFASYFIHFNSIFELDQITEVNGNSSKSKIFCPNNVYLQLGT